MHTGGSLAGKDLPPKTLLPRLNVCSASGGWKSVCRGPADGVHPVGGSFYYWPLSLVPQDGGHTTFMKITAPLFLLSD